MASKFKPLVLYATDFYKLSSLLVKRVLLSKPVGNLAAYKEKTKQLLLDQSRPSASPNVAAVKLLHLDREFGLLQYYGVQEYARRWMKSRPSPSSPTPQSITQATEQVGGTSNNSNNNNNVARVAFMITSEQRRKLSADLGYTQQDIRSFKPIEALLLIENDVKKTSPSDGDAQYNFRDRLKELVDENEELMAKQASPSSSSVATENKKETVIEKPQSISPEDAEHAHVKADVAMALLSAEKGDDHKVEDVSIAKEQQTPEDVSNDEKEVTSSITLIDEDDADKQGISDDISTKTEKSNIDAAPKPALPLSVKVTPNDSTELHMKPDIAAAFIGSHLQKEESTIGVSDVSDTDEEEEDGPGWYEVVMGSMDAEEKAEQEDEVVALFATKKEALECVEIKKKLASGKDKTFSVRRRWNV